MGITKESFLVYVRGLENQSVDTDGVYNAQCVDLITHVQKKFWNFWGQGNAVDFKYNAMPAGWTRNTPQNLPPQPGDILVWKWGSTDIYGHIGICTSVNGGMVTSLEQNVDGTFGGPARYRTRDLSGCIAVLRPNFDTATAPAPVARKEYAENGTYTVGVDAVRVRRSPDTNTTPVATYYKGQSVKYDKVIVDVNGYVWVSYIGLSSGKRNYIATGQTKNGVRYGAAWGTFK